MLSLGASVVAAGVGVADVSINHIRSFGGSNEGFSRELSTITDSVSASLVFAEITFMVRCTRGGKTAANRVVKALQSPDFEMKFASNLTAAGLAVEEAQVECRSTWSI